MSERNLVDVGFVGSSASPSPLHPTKSETPTCADPSLDGAPFEWLEGRARWSRRDFIKGVIASGVAVSGVPYLASAASRPTLQAGAIERLISLNVNGQTRRVDVLPNETLAMTLRYKLGLTGTKLGCDRAERSLHRVDRQRDALLVLHADATRSRERDHDGRGAGEFDRRTPPGPTGIHGRIGPAVRLLHAGPGDGGRGSPDGEPESDPGGGAPGDVGKCLPVRRLRPLSQWNHARSEGGVTWPT